MRRIEWFNPYGSMEAATAQIYGRLDPSPTLIPSGAYGMVWNVEGWAMPPILERAGLRCTAELRRRIAQELTGTFTTSYRKEIPLMALLQPYVLLDFCKKETGGKYLILPEID